MSQIDSVGFTASVKKKLKAVLLVFVFIAALLTLIGGLTDEELLPYHDLKVAPQISDKDNGFYQLDHLFDEHQSEELSHAAFVIEYGEQEYDQRPTPNFANYLRVVAAVVAKPDFQTNLDDPFGLLLHSVYENLMEIVIGDSKRLADSGDLEATIDRIKLGVIFSERVLHDKKPTHMSYRRARDIQLSLLEWVHELVSSYSLTSQQVSELRTFSEYFSGFDKDGFEFAIAGEHQLEALFFERHYSPGIVQRIKNLAYLRDLFLFSSPSVDSLFDMADIVVPGYFSQPNVQINVSLNRHQTTLSQASRFCSEVELGQASFQRIEPSARWLLPGEYGRRFEHGEPQSAMHVFLRRCNSVFYIQAIRAVLAAYQYKNDNERWPQKLEELVPNYLDSIPLDPFTGSELSYDFDNKWFYSPGDNFIDQGGNLDALFNGSCAYQEVCRNQPTVTLIYQRAKKQLMDGVEDLNDATIRTGIITLE